MSFSVAVDTREVPQSNVSQAAGKESDKEPKPTPTPEPLFHFSDVPEDKRGPKIKMMQPDELQVAIEVPSLNMSLLPAVVHSELQKLEEKLLVGDITMKGYNLTKAELLKSYITLAQKQQVINLDPAATVQGKPYKDLEGEPLVDQPPLDEKAGSIIQRKQMSKNEVVVQGNAFTPHVPVHIDDEQKKEFEKPMASKLLSSISKSKSAQSQEEPAAAARGVLVGRRLQHFITSDRGFLPWERRKYFQELLEVRRVKYFSVQTFDFLK